MGIMDTASKVIHDFFTLFAIIATFILIGLSIGAKKDHNSLFLTNTFLSTYYSDVPSITFSPSRSPYTSDEVAATFYGCLYEAQVGANDAVGCYNSTFSDYYECITTKTTSMQYRKKHLVDAVQNTLSAFRGNAWNVSTLPSLVTTSDVATLGDSLFNPLKQNQILTSLHNIDSILSRELLKSIKLATANMGIPGCLLTVDQSPGILHDIAPIYDMLWQCTAGVVHTETANRKAFDLCIPQSAWPTLDVIQTPYSSTFLGSYNKHFVLVIGMWLLCSFAVYGAWVGVDGMATANGKPEKIFARAGKFLTGFGFVWNFSAIIIVFARGFTPADTANNFPMSIQTVMVTMLASVAATMYFGRELWEIIQYGGGSSSNGSGRSERDPEVDTRRPSSQGFDRAPSNLSPSDSKKSSRQPGAPVDLGPSNGDSSLLSRMSNGRRYTQLGTFVKVPGRGQSTGDLHMEELAPLLVPTWSDSLLICDGLLLLGVIGTSQDVVTADIVLCFLYATAGAAVHSAFIRLIEKAYEPSESGGTQGDLQALKVMTMVSDIAVIMFLMVYWYLTLARYGDVPVIQSYVIMTSTIPAAVWLLVNILMDFGVGEIVLVYPAQIMFIYNIAIRTIYVFVIVSTIQRDINATFYDDFSLLTMLRYIST